MAKRSIGEVMKESLVFLDRFVVPRAGETVVASKVPPRPTKPEHKNVLVLSEKEEAFLDYFFNHPEHTMTQRCDRLEIDRFQDRRLREKFDRLGFLRIAFSVSNQKLPCLTKKGEDWLRAHGRDVVHPNPDWPHRICELLVEARLTQVFPGVSFDHGRELGGVRLDLLAKLPGPEGRRIGVQISFENSVAFECDALLRAVQAVDACLLVAKTAAKAKAISQLLDRDEIYVIDVNRALGSAKTRFDYAVLK